MAKVKLIITESKCRSGFHRKGQEFIIDETLKLLKIEAMLW